MMRSEHEAGHYLPVFHVVQFALFGQEQQAASVSCSGCIAVCTAAAVCGHHGDVHVECT
jgi:hypothetical protein